MIFMAKYFTREHLKEAGIFASHFIPGYSTFRSRNILREYKARAKGKNLMPTDTYRKYFGRSLAANALCDVIGSALLAYSLLGGPLAIIPTVYVGFKGLPGISEHFMRRDLDDSSGALLREEYRLSPAEA